MNQSKSRNISKIQDNDVQNIVRTKMKFNDKFVGCICGR